MNKKKTKITDIFYFPLNHELSLETIEQLFLQAIEREDILYKIPDSDKVLYLGLPPDELVNDIQKEGIQELIAENKKIGYITKKGVLISFVAYIC